MAQFHITISGFVEDSPKGKEAFAKLFADTTAAARAMPGYSDEGHGNDVGAFMPLYEAETYYRVDQPPEQNAIRQAQMDAAKG